MGASDPKKFILRDAAIVVSSVIIAVILARTGVLTNILTSTKELELLGSFIAGIFFTSVFSTAPAIVTLGEIARANSIVLTAAVGAAGAVLGDLVIFRFIRDRLAEHLAELVKHQKGRKRIEALLKRRLFRWLTFFVGGLIIASPLPDEIGIGLLGFSKMRMAWFTLLSFTLNFSGILLIGIVAKAL